MATIIMDIRHIIAATEIPIKDPSRGLSIIIDCGGEFAIVWTKYESEDIKVVVILENVVAILQ